MLRDAARRDTARLTLEQVFAFDVLGANANEPPIENSGAPTASTGNDSAGLGGALHVSKPLWLGSGGFFQTGIRVSGLIGYAGNIAGTSAISLNIGGDLHYGHMVSMRMYFGPYMSSRLLGPGYINTAGFYQGVGWTIAMGADPRNRILILLNQFMPLAANGSRPFDCSDGSRCFPIFGISLGIEGMFL